jgi:uncharacterized protein
MSWEVVFGLILAGFSAGAIDAMVGGGGLIQVPALFWLFPNYAPATIMGCSKFAGIFGTAAAFRQYVKRIEIPWRTLIYGAIGAGVGAFIGAWLLTKVSNQQFKTALPFLLTAIFIYTLKRRDFGGTHQPKFVEPQQAQISAMSSTAMGLYDGFFGPGTGSFLVFLFVRVFGFDFVHASAMAKGINVACNAAALTFFIGGGHLQWLPAIILAIANLTGGVIGSKLALKHGSAWVRKVFIVVVGALILRTIYSALFVT